MRTGGRTCHVVSNAGLGTRASLSVPDFSFSGNMSPCAFGQAGLVCQEKLAFGLRMGWPPGNGQLRVGRLCINQAQLTAYVINWGDLKNGTGLIGIRKSD